MPSCNPNYLQLNSNHCKFVGRTHKTVGNWGYGYRLTIWAPQPITPKELVHPGSTPVKNTSAPLSLMGFRVCRLGCRVRAPVFQVRILPYTESHGTTGKKIGARVLNLNTLNPEHLWRPVSAPLPPKPADGLFQALLEGLRSKLFLKRK